MNVLLLFLQLLYYNACPLARDLETLARQTPEFLDFQNVSQPLFQFLSKHAGKTMNNADDVKKICDTIVTENENNLPLTWQREILPQCEEYCAEMFNFRFGWNMAPFKGHDMRIEKPKVLGGPLLWEIITRMQQKYENYVNPSNHTWISDLKYYVYSGHDTVLFAFAAMMDFQYSDYDRNITPSPSNAYTIELWLNDNMEPIVKVLYWRKESLSYIDVSKSISGCKFTVDGCSLEHFAERSQKYKPPDNFDEVGFKNHSNNHFIFQYCNSRLTDIL